MMKRRKILLTIAMVVGVLAIAAAGWVWDGRLRIDAEERQAHFISVHFRASEAAQESVAMLGSPPADLGELLEVYGGRNSMLLKPFPDGLIYHSKGSSFTLEEPKARWVSLFRSDRLIGSESKWPRWEISKKYARKFAGQEVPPAGYPAR